jgi:hypothetical protein
MPIGNIFTYTTGLGALFGGVVGGVVGGPATAIEFAKVGGALGVQTAVATKAGDAGDALAAKAEVVLDKTGESMQKFMNVAGVALEQIADTWSKVFLCGYAIHKTLGSSDYAIEIYSKHCTTMFDSLNCTSLSMTNLSLNVSTAIMTGVLAVKMYQIVLGAKK